MGTAPQHKAVHSGRKKIEKRKKKEKESPQNSPKAIESAGSVTM